MNRRKIAILMASIDREYQMDFVHGAFAAAAERNLDVCVFNCQGYMNVEVSTSDQRESAIFDLPRIREFDGVISLRATLADEFSAQKVEQVLRKMKGKPHISIDVPTEDGVSIMFDDAVSVEKLTEHLITVHGAKNIVYLSGPQRQMVAMTRLQACRKTMRAHGLDLLPEDVFEGEWIYSSGRDCGKQLLERGGPLPDAIVCGNDDMAFGVAEYLQEQGYQIPDDVMVTGFDALREAVARGMTSIRRPIDRMAEKAIEVLCGWMEGEIPKEPLIYLSTYPIYGDSCGCDRCRPQVKERPHMLRARRRYVDNTLLQISAFNGSLASVVDEADAHDKIDQFVHTIGIEELYLCIHPSLTREEAVSEGEFAYPEQMILLYGREGDRTIPITSFRTEELLPVLDEERDRTLTLIFCPLYYRERNFGYLAMNLGSAAALALYSILMMLSGALTSLYLQSSLRTYARKVEEMSVRDIMTGMLNRRGFMERSPQLLEQARTEKKPFVMLSADMDYMKRINDQYGHLTGDQAICRMGRAMETLREKNMVPVHISGDEFLAYGIADSMEDTKKILPAALEAMQRLNDKEPWIVETSASIGIYAAVPQKGDTIDHFLTRADHAMYEEKMRKKGRTAGERRIPGIETGVPAP